jgi:UDP-glucose 4-epimerase
MLPKLKGFDGDTVNQNSQISITGGAGFIGAALANELFDRGFSEINLLDNLSTGDWSRLNFEANRISIDLSIATVEELVDALTGIDILFHLSAVKLHNEKNSFDDIIKHNVLATQNLLDAAGLAGVKKVVFTSSLYSYGMLKIETFTEDLVPVPSTVYGASKLFGESLVAIASRKYGFDYSIARLFFIYGEKQYSDGGYKSVIVNNFERLKSDQQAVIHGDGGQILDYLHVSDCVSALISLSQNTTNDVYNVSSGVPLTITELTNEMLRVTGKKTVRYVDPDWTQGTRRVGSYRKIHELTGWVPNVSLNEGLSRTWESLN